MSNLPISSKYRATPQLPVTDAERDDLNTRLNAAFADGVIDTDQYRELLDRVYAARELGELAIVAEALPARDTFTTPSNIVQGAGRPGELVEAKQPNRGLMLGTAAGIGGGILLGIILLLLILF